MQQPQNTLRKTMDIYELYMDISEAINGPMPSEAELTCLDEDDGSPWDLQLIDRDWSYIGHGDLYESIEEHRDNKWKYINARNRFVSVVLTAFEEKSSAISELLNQPVHVITETDRTYFGEEKELPIGFSLTIHQKLEDIPPDSEPFEWSEEATKRIANGGPVYIDVIPVSGAIDPLIEDEREPDPSDD